MSTIGHVVVVGGGLAGLTAALACADGGSRVTLLEGRPRLGGATWSFERNGRTFDNGQHVYLRCCTAYRRFLERVGTASKAPLQERLALPVLAPGGNGAAPRVSWIRRDRLPAPMHLGRSLAAYSHLSLADRARLGLGLVALKRLRLSDRSLDEESFGSFLSRNHQSDAAIAMLWDLITLPTLNVRAKDASLRLAAKVFRTGLLDENDGADIGWSRIPLAELHVTPAVAILEAQGASIRKGAKVRAIEAAPLAESGSGVRPGAGRVTVVLEDDRVEADAVVLAVPHESAAELLPPGGRLDPTSLLGLGTSPIVDVHVVYDRKVTEFAIGAGVRTPVQYFFDRTESAGIDPGDGQCLAVSISGADGEHGDRPEALVERYTSALEELLPAARRARVLDALVTREHQATFRAAPGTAALRPGPMTGFDGLFLAGSWTDTGWPATMEGAVRSGTVAASCALGLLRRGVMTDQLAEEVAWIPTQSVPEILGRARALVEPALKTAVDRLSPELRPVAQYHLGWVDVDGKPVGGDGGKGIRPALALLSAEAVGAPSVLGIPGGVAIELVHNFSLIHDDVIDGDDERRHRPTVWALFGIGRAVIVGDALLALAQQVVCDPSAVLGISDPALRAVDSTLAVAALADATAAMIAGQALDMAFETLPAVDVEGCLAMEAGKTGALLGCAASIGALLGGASSEVVAALDRYGIELGLAFQAVDDLLGIWGDPETTGKPAWSDLRQHKKTLPVAAALASSSPHVDELAALLTGDRLSEAEIATAASLVEACGGRTAAAEEADRRLSAALSALDSVELVGETRDALVELARFVVERDY